MPRTRPPYPPELRKQMVELVRTGRTRRNWRGNPSPRRLRFGSGFARPTWMKRAATVGLTSEEKEELRRLQRENRPRVERET